MVLRYAVHPTFDRVVFDFGTSRVPAYTVTPQPTNVFRIDPSDLPVTLAGTQGIRVALQFVSAPPAFGDKLLPSYPKLKQVSQIGNFEMVVSYGLGVQGRVVMHVFTLTSPNRLVVDIAH